MVEGRVIEAVKPTIRALIIDPRDTKAAERRDTVVTEPVRRSPPSAKGYISDADDHLVMVHNRQHLLIGIDVKPRPVLGCERRGCREDPESKQSDSRTYR